MPSGGSSTLDPRATARKSEPHSRELLASRLAIRLIDARPNGFHEALRIAERYFPDCTISEFRQALAIIKRGLEQERRGEP